MGLYALSSNVTCYSLPGDFLANEYYRTPSEQIAAPNRDLVESWSWTLSAPVTLLRVGFHHSPQTLCSGPIVSVAGLVKLWLWSSYTPISACGFFEFSLVTRYWVLVVVLAFSGPKYLVCEVLCGIFIARKYWTELLCFSKRTCMFYC